MKRIFSLFLLVVIVASCTRKQSFQSVLLPEDEYIYIPIMDSLCEHAYEPMGDLIVRAAIALLSTPYVAATLEQSPEQLHVYLSKTDCILFVELTVSLAYTAKKIMLTPSGYECLQDFKEQPGGLLCHNIRQMRYRKGIIDGYASRIHYTSEWIRQNENRGIMHEFSDILGEEYDEPFFFMSTHPQYYRQLADDSIALLRISHIEQCLTKDKPYFYIPQTTLQQPEIISQIRNGDIIAFVSTADGLDLAHVAIAYEMNGTMHFIHASSRAGKVIIEPTDLTDYADNGIRVVRIHEPERK